MAQQLRKVLLIDDEEDVIQYFTERFADYKDLRLLTATRAREGIEIAVQEKPEVVLMDLRLPVMSGETALRELKPVLPKTKFIVITGCGDEEMRNRIEQEIVVDAFFDKPLDFDELIAKVFEFVRPKGSEGGRTP